MAVKTNRKPVEEIRRYLQAGMPLKDAALVTGYSSSALSIMCLVWGIKLKRGPRKDCKLVAQP
jgi:hypothetical protein